MKRGLILFLAGLLILGMFAGCAAPKDEGKLIMGTNADFPPFELRNEQNEVDGFDVDIAKAVAKSLGKELVIEDIAFDGLIPALKTDKIDIAVAGITITPEREEDVNFSTPYYNAGQTVVVREENDEIQSVDDLDGKLIAVQLGTTGDLEAHDRFPAENISQFNQVNEAFLELGNKRVDAIIIDIPVAERYIEIKGGFKTVGGAFTEELFGIAVKKENTELLEQINGVLADLEESGEFGELLLKWFE
jgi:ABC-type amino acid transport substrate-binding protein